MNDLVRLANKRANLILHLTSIRKYNEQSDGLEKYGKQQTYNKAKLAQNRDKESSQIESLEEIFNAKKAKIQAEFDAKMNILETEYKKKKNELIHKTTHYTNYLLDEMARVDKLLAEGKPKSLREIRLEEELIAVEKRIKWADYRARHSDWTQRSLAGAKEPEPTPPDYSEPSSSNNSDTFSLAHSDTESDEEEEEEEEEEDSPAAILKRIAEAKEKARKEEEAQKARLERATQRLEAAKKQLQKEIDECPTEKDAKRRAALKDKRRSLKLEDYLTDEDI